MRDHRLEQVCLHELDHQVDRPAGHTNVFDHALALEIQQHRDWATSRHRFFERRVLGIVQVDQLQSLDA